MVEPDGIFGKPLALAADMLASIGAFQTWVGAVDATAARAKIDFCLAGSALRNDPGVMIDYGKDYTSKSLQFGSPSSWKRGTTVFLFFEKSFEADTTEQDAIITFTNEVGAIWKAFEGLGNTNTAGGLLLNETMILAGPELAYGPRHQRENGSTVSDEREVRPQVNLALLIHTGNM